MPSRPCPALPMPALSLGQVMPIARALFEYFAHVPQMHWQNLRRYGNCDSCHSPSEPVFRTRPPNRPVPCCRQPLVNALRPSSRSTDSRGYRKRTIHNADRVASFPFAMPDLRVLCCLKNPCPVSPPGG